MRALFQWLLSSVGKKYILAATGLGLFGFLITHLAANLFILAGDGGTVFNTYPHQLEKWGSLLYVAEFGLLGIFVVHVALAIVVSIAARRARGTNIGHAAQTKGGASHFSLASRWMIVTGILILGFVVIHLFHLKFGPGIAQGYITDINGEQARDLYRLVIESFTQPGWALFYCVCMVVLGFHLRHGIWSAFQSLGLGTMMSGASNSPAYRIALIAAVLMAGGFLLIPLVVFMRGGSGS